MSSFNRSIFEDKTTNPHDSRLNEQIERQTFQRQLDRLQLINMTLWSFIQEKHGISDKELIARMREIDLLDGTLDGTYRKTATICVECARTIPVQQRRCMYCNAEQPADTPFDAR